MRGVLLDFLSFLLLLWLFIHLWIDLSRVVAWLGKWSAWFFLWLRRY